MSKYLKEMKVLAKYHLGKDFQGAALKCECAWQM